jgi:hypothetical protein
LDKLLEYKTNWIQHVNRIPRNRLPRVMKHYCLTGRRNHGRLLKRRVDTWDRNGSTGGPTAWQIADDEDHDGTDVVRVYHEVRTEFIVFFAKLRKATISSAMSVFPSGTSRLPLDRITWNLIWEFFVNLSKKLSTSKPENKDEYFTRRGSE